LSIYYGDGEIELLLPAEIVDGIYSVKSGGEDIPFKQAPSTESTTLKFSVPTNSRSIEIFGSTVVPEFSVMVFLVLAISSLIIIGLTRTVGRVCGKSTF